MGRFSYLSHLECSRCGAVFEAQCLWNTCHCGFPLLARYDLESLGRDLHKSELTLRPSTLWRFHELLPVTNPNSIVSLGESVTPLLPLPALGSAIGIERLFLKDESSLPTGTFKARGATAGVSRARELGVKKIAMPTNGNAGAAWAAYAARAGLQAAIIMPEDAPEITRRECVISGATVGIVSGSIKDAGIAVRDLIAQEGYFDTSTLKEPYRLEGKKTMILEILEQRDWRLPSVIIYPTGGGVGIIGIYKALRELQSMGWIEGELPRLVAVQAAGCAPIVAAYDQGASESKEWPNPTTAAFGISVPKALGDFLVLEAVADTLGTALAVTDEHLLAAQRRLAHLEGIFCCPEGGAALAAAAQLRESGWIGDGDEVVVLNTGTGLKYPETVPMRLNSACNGGPAYVSPLYS